MKGIDIFCASQASTAIYVSMDQGSSSSSSSICNYGGGRAIDRHNPIIRDARRSSRALITPCSSQPPITPKPYHHLHHHKSTRKSSANKTTTDDHLSKKSSAKSNDHQKRKSSNSKPTDIALGKSCAKPGDLISPPVSSRYLLSDTHAFFEVLSDFDPVLTLVPVEPTKSQAVKQDESFASKPSSSSSSRSADQVVVLRVSLHCKGCEGKLRKHLSRMKGVTSFNIDFAAKKVTVVGDVTPLGVLASVSKVKNAQLWTSAVSSSPPSSVGMSNVEMKR